MDLDRVSAGWTDRMDFGGKSGGEGWELPVELGIQIVSAHPVLLFPMGCRFCEGMSTNIGFTDTSC